MSLLVRIHLFLLPLILFQVKGCPGTERERLDAPAYIAWLENPDHGMLVSKKIGELEFTLQYKPLPYEVLMNEKRAMTSVEMKAEIDSISAMQYYTFRIATEDGSDMQRYHVGNDQEYYARLEYFALQMQNDIQLVDGRDTLPCRLFHFERTYGIDPRASFVLAFDAYGSKVADKTFIFSDHVLGTGPVLLTVASTDIQQIPELTLSDKP